MSKVYTGTGRLFQEVQAVPLDEEALTDIERRIKVQPHFLGEPLVVIGEAADFPQYIAANACALVALDVAGRLVIISLAVGAADTDLGGQGLQLAANLAALHPEELGKIARSFVSRPANDGLRRGWEEMGVEISDDSVELCSLLAATFERDAEDYAELINAQQRIIVAAEGFTSRLVGLIDWLVKAGVGITGLRYKKYLVGGQEIYFAEQVVPMVDPAVDAREQRRTSPEASEPWRVKGRSYHLERLSPAVGNLLDELLLAVRDTVFSLNWSHKYYFWVRGPRRNLRVRTFSRDHLEIGFYNASPRAVEELLERHGLRVLEVSTLGGYSDSPFITLPGDYKLSPPLVNLLREWLGGENVPPARSRE